jgi:hypothetical protein
MKNCQAKGKMTKNNCPEKKQECIVYVRYLDHVLFSRCEPLVLKPQVRETVGWLTYECEEYIIVSWDRDSGPPTLKNGDAKASGLVIAKKLILEKKGYVF